MSSLKLLIFVVLFWTLLGVSFQLLDFDSNISLDTSSSSTGLLGELLKIYTFNTDNILPNIISNFLTIIMSFILSIAIYGAIRGF